MTNKIRGRPCHCDESEPIDKVAEKFGYRTSTIYALLRDAKAARITLFPTVGKGPKKRQTHSDVQDRIIELRKQDLSTPDICQRLREDGINSSVSTIERILKTAGFAKLARRTNKELGKSKSNAIIYTRADILRSEEANEVKTFVTFWRDVNGNADETLVFDCKFSAYEVLDELATDKVKLITLRKRYASLVESTLQIPDKEWQKVYLAIPERKCKCVSTYASEVKLKGCQTTFRQIAIKDHGRSKPTFVLTNNWDLPLKEILEVYAKRWRIENKLAELIAFSNLNALADGFQHYPGYQHESANKFQVHYSSNFFPGSGTAVPQNRFDSSNEPAWETNRKWYRTKGWRQSGQLIVAQK